MTDQHALGPLHRGDRVVMARGTAVLVVWEDLGRGVQLTSEDGYRRAIAGDPETPIVGFPRQDIAALVERGNPDPSRPPTNPPLPSGHYRRGELDPCGECLVGTCDRCDDCVQFTEWAR